MPATSRSLLRIPYILLWILIEREKSILKKEYRRHLGEPTNEIREQIASGYIVSLQASRNYVRKIETRYSVKFYLL